MPITLKSTGGGSVSIDVPSTGSTFTLTAPANNATIFTTDGGAITGNVAFTSNNVSIGGQTISPFNGMTNRIINGDMRIDQRNAGASANSGSAGGNYTLDRWGTYVTGGGVFSAQQSSTAPTGFANSQIITVTSADSSIAAGDVYQLRTTIEGLNCSDLAWGTSAAKTITLSFWVRSSVTGTFSVSMRNYAGDRSYVATYTISAANTWEYKTITMPGDTTGTWLTTNSGFCYLTWSIGCGSTWETTAGSWQAGNYLATSGSVDLISTLNATYYLTGVQLEVGSVATPFEFRSIGQELALCQRYYQTWGGTVAYEHLCVGYTTGTTYGEYCLPFLVTMRSPPSASVSSASHWQVLDTATGVTPSSMVMDQIGLNSIRITANFTGLIANRPSIIRGNNTLSARFNLSAEL